MMAETPFVPPALPIGPPFALPPHLCPPFCPSFCPLPPHTALCPPPFALCSPILPLFLLSAALFCPFPLPSFCPPLLTFAPRPSLFAHCSLPFALCSPSFCPPFLPFVPPFCSLPLSFALCPLPPFALCPPSFCPLPPPPHTFALCPPPPSPPVSPHPTSVPPRAPLLLRPPPRPPPPPPPLRSEVPPTPPAAAAAFPPALYSLIPAVRCNSSTSSSGPAPARWGRRGGTRWTGPKRSPSPGMGPELGSERRDPGAPPSWSFCSALSARLGTERSDWPRGVREGGRGLAGRKGRGRDWVAASGDWLRGRRAGFGEGEGAEGKSALIG